jgi:DNA polymerase I-like protein with 3'-5' exonuclease and polymerase domains
MLLKISCTPGRSARFIIRRKYPMRIPSPDSPTADLLKAVTLAGFRFRLMGGQIRVTGRASPELRPVLDALKGRREELISILGGDAGQPSIDLLDALGVTAIVPTTAEEARALLAELITDSRKITPSTVQRQGGVWLGFDIETAALPGEEERPAVHLRLRDGLPAANQPRFKGKAGLDPHRSRIRLLQLYGGGERCLVLDTSQVPIDAIAEAFRSCTLAIHNAGFELRFLAEAGIELSCFEDTMQAAGLLLGVHRRSLEDAASAYLGIEVPKALQRSDWGAPLLSEGQIAYAALDAVLAFQLWRKMRLELHAKGRGGAYALQRDVTRATVRMIQRGIALDLEAHQRQVAKWEAEAAAARQAFIAETREAPPITPAETRAFLMKVLPPDEIRAWPRTPKSGELSTEGPELRRHVDVPAIRSLLTINAMVKLQSTFGLELAKKVSAVSGRLHPGFNVASTKAGRFSCNDPNVQQIPKHKAAGFRGCFVAAPGKVLVIADYNAMELRAAAEVSNDTAMRADFAKGVDLHRRQAAEMLGIGQEEVTEQQRSAAKPICFGTIYGAGRRGLVASAWNSYGLLLTGDEAEAARQAFLGRYPDLAAWMDRSYAQSNEQGYIAVGKLGRAIEAVWESPKPPDGSCNWHRDDDSDELLDPIDDGEEWLARPLPWRTTLKRTQCCNAPIQGACADAAMRALILVDSAQFEAGIDGGPVIFNHDEIVLEVREADAERARTNLVEGMTRAFAETFPDAPLNGLVETKVSKAWGPRDEHDAAVEPIDGDTGGPDLPAGGVPCPADGEDTAASADQRGRPDGRGLSPCERVDVQAADADLNNHYGDEEVQGKSEPSAAFLAGTCERCGASPCTVFGETTTFCTLQCWQASYAA